jgi:hypothetical protein
MADTKVSALADIVTLADGDKVPVADASDLTASKSATMTEINAYVQTKALASAQITALPAASALETTNTFPVDQSGTAGEATFAQLETLLQAANGAVRVTTVTGITGTEVTTLSQTLEAGTYTFKYTLLTQSGTSTTGVGLGINFTGTAATKVFARRNVATITTASNGLTEEESGAALVTGGVLNGWASKTYTTTAPNMMAEGVGAINADLLDIIEGLIIVTVSGDLELWHSSQIAATTTLVKIGSALVVTRVA